jgi:hypothetical protein
MAQAWRRPRESGEADAFRNNQCQPLWVPAQGRDDAELTGTTLN